MAEVVDLLERPVYTYPQVDRLLNLTSGTSKRWLNGYRRNGVSYPPILRLHSSNTRWVTWGEFVETRLFAGYRDVDNIPARRMRRIVEALRRLFDRTYPLAYAAPYTRAEGRRVLWQAQNEADLPDEFVVEVDTGQIALAPWVKSFTEAVTFGVEPADGVVIELRPDPDFSAVVVDPTLRGGEPVIAGHNVRASTVASLVRGGDRIEDVAEWYGLSTDDVRQAVNYDRLHARIA